MANISLIKKALPGVEKTLAKEGLLCTSPDSENLPEKKAGEEKNEVGTSTEGKGVMGGRGDDSRPRGHPTREEIY